MEINHLPNIKALTLITDEVKKVIHFIKNNATITNKRKVSSSSYEKIIQEFKAELDLLKTTFKVKLNNETTAIVLISRKTKTVIKIGGECDSIRNFKVAHKYAPKYAVPTVIIQLDKKNNENCNFVRIQPLVKIGRKEKKKALSVINKISAKKLDKLFGNDPHEKNIGIWNGKPVVFDW